MRAPRGVERMQQRAELAVETVLIRPVYLAPEFCAEFGVSVSTMRQEIDAGRLRAFKLGARIAIAGEDALAWRDGLRAKGYVRGHANAHPGRREVVPTNGNTGRRKVAKV